jgi:hypothetical protein
MILIKTIETAWQAATPWYKSGLIPIIEIINNCVKDDLLNTSATGLIFICENGGYDASIDLWKAAIEQGVRFVNPAPFPYSLSSSPAGFVAKACSIFGPVIVLVEKENGSTQEELNVYANNIFLQQVTHLFLVKASLYDSSYRFKATVSLYAGKIKT